MFERSVIPAAMAALGLLVSLSIHYPGYMSTDSVIQLLQARAGIYTDWFPPAMAVFWRLWDRVVPGPFGMLLTQSILAWSAA